MKKIMILGLVLTVLFLMNIKVLAFENMSDSPTKEEIESSLRLMEQDCIYTDFQDSYFKKGEKINIPFEIRNKMSNQEYYIEVEAENINLEENKLRTIEGNFDLSFSTITLGEFEMKIIAYTHEVRYEYFVYIYSTESIDFISKVSITQAKREFFIYQYKNNQVKDDEYNQIVYGYKRHTNIEEVTEQTPSVNGITMSTTSSNIINVYGYVKFTDTQNGIHPAVGMKVTLYDEDLFGIRQTLAVTYTSSTGLYWFSVENDTSIFENGYDIT
ncbi:MAG: hypothetical protein JEZ05_11050 [Tenericutes bacterium]|nr:hypothetical protein [Mycoplasmatota bacterium]